MKIVVTGALGHIGSRFIREIPAAFPGARIVMIDNMSTQRYCSLFNLPTKGNYVFVEGNVLEYDLEKLTDGADVAVHLAAITDAAGSFEIREKVEYENFTALKRVAEACSKTGTAIIHLSSTSVYGTQNEVVDEACSESDLKPQSPYAETKLKEESFLVSLGNSSGLRFVTCRFGTICGVSPGMRFHTAVNKFCWQAVLGQPLTIWTTAYDQKRPYLDLAEAVEALKFIISRDLFDGRVYNVLTANLTVRDIVDMIRKKIGDVNVQFVESPIMNQLSYEVLNKRFKSTGFNFHGDLENAINETIEQLC
ncbi:MAG: SDR family oxidoreductase [Desulfobacterales bacterium]|jgi:nucleoside-diphosphate-sugar epimerase